MNKIVVIVADIYNSKKNLNSEFMQEWESKDSIYYLQKIIRTLGFKTFLFEPKKNNEIFLSFLKKTLSEIHLRKKKSKDFIIFNLIEGFLSRNREGYIPSLSEFFGIPHTGSDSYAQSITLDKKLSKLIAKNIGIPVKPHFVIRSMEELVKINTSKRLIWKPNYEGSGISISSKNIIQKNAKLSGFEKIINNYKEIIFEEYLPGDEYTVGVIGNRGNYKTTKVARIIYQGNVYGSDIKTKSSMPEKLKFDLERKIEKKIQEYILNFSVEVGISGYGRFDFKCDEKGNPFFLEVNLTPGLSYKYSTFPICYMETFQKDYKEMINQILKLAIEDFKDKRFLYGRYGQ